MMELIRDKGENKRKSRFGRWGKGDVEDDEYDRMCVWRWKCLVDFRWRCPVGSWISMTEAQERAGLDCADLVILHIVDLAQREPIV